MLKRHLRTLVACATVLGLGLALCGRRDALTAFDWNVSWPALLAASTLFAVAPLVQAAVFWLCLRMLGADAEPGVTIRLWMRGFLARYAPSGVVGYAVRARARERMGADAPTLWTATAYEQLVALLAGATVCVGAFLVAGTRPPVLAMVSLVAAVLAAVALRPALVDRLLGRLLAGRGPKLVHLLRGRELAGLVAAQLVSWIPTGAAAWVLVHGLAPGRVHDPAWLLGAFAAAWLVGFVVPGLPGGLGVRDAVLAGLLAAPLGLGTATAVALAIRLAGTLGELLAAGAAELAPRLRRARPVPMERPA